MLSVSKWLEALSDSYKEYKHFENALVCHTWGELINIITEQSSESAVSFYCMNSHVSGYHQA